MRVLTVGPANYDCNLCVIDEMHRLRRRVFKDRLDWDVSVTGDREVDPYDAMQPTYLIGLAENGAVTACARLLPTTGPYMLANTFPALLADHRAPRSPLIFESSRFCVDALGQSDSAVRGLRRTTFALLAAVLEWGLRHGQQELVTVTDVRFERILKRAGWPLQRFAPPIRIGKTLALAGRLPINGVALSIVRSVGEVGSSVPSDEKKDGSAPAPERGSEKTAEHRESGRAADAPVARSQIGDRVIRAPVPRGAW